jgi:hypothetical protein
VWVANAYYGWTLDRSPHFSVRQKLYWGKMWKRHLREQARKKLVTDSISDKVFYEEVDDALRR